jgi:peptidoglycan-associated lipoprotein
MRSISFAAFAAAAMLATACASNPEPEPAPAPAPAAPAPAPAPAPVIAAPAPAVPSGPMAGSKEDFALKTNNGADQRVYFDYDQYNLDASDQRAIAAQASWLKSNPAKRVQVEGNADERGTPEYNIALSARRANSVADYLRSQGIDGSRVSTVPNGERFPIDPGNNEASWSKNRNAYTNLVN